ncbi:MAG: hypothetical protein JWQ76_1233 [Ramlibacter sp.]|nr:hypothetical protein [Ramlibacter sp.]
MKSALILAAAALACGAALAQAPAGVVKTPSQESNPNVSGGKAQAKGEMNAETKGSMASAGATATMGGYKAMDANGDGYVSRKEWNDYHGKMWGTMKPNKRGMVPWADVEAKMKGGPN